MHCTIKDRIKQIQDRIDKSARDCGRAPSEIQLVAVGKKKPVELIRQAAQSGVSIIGENYIQEARSKFETLLDQPIRWHFIGHLQKNKAKYAVRIFELIHTVDSLELARELNKCADKAGKVQQILVQVNISGEETKSGIGQSQVLPLIQSIQKLPCLALKGLMTMPPYFENPEQARPYFQALRKLRDSLVKKVSGLRLSELSMGMSGDFQVAIEEGASLVRVGTALFGKR
ncbi:MAG: YggS family pyridoxal phosphate-dependent enzyme [Desulfobacteraceae bacterium]|nr:YggS family pyridoxal phosphate-dependent enzyme [Desulfobacteraceae bacterium]